MKVDGSAPGPGPGSDVPDHPAVVAWRTLRPRQRVPLGVEELRAGPNVAIYRLAGIGRDDTDVIVKRSPMSAAMIERAVYAQVLPDIPVSSPHFYGMAADQDGRGWLFIQDVGTTRFAPALPAHRTLAAEWLGRMHAAATRNDVAARLPDRGAAHYLDHLRFGRETIGRSLDNPVLTPEDRHLLATVSAQCDALERGWKQIERLCADVPCTLVHGDFRSKNVRVRALDSGTSLFPLDWETAGWGVPAADLAATRGVTPVEQVDLATYCSIACEYWPRLDAAVLDELVAVGGVFRRLAAISWVSLHLAQAWPQKALASLHVYHDDLRALCRDWAPGLDRF